MRALVTGAAGFIGSRLLARLRGAGHSAVGLDLRPSDLVADVRDTDAVQRALARVEPDAVFHLAGPVASGFTHDFHGAVRLQVEGTLAVLEAARRRPAPPTLVLASSYYVYLSQPPAAVVDEDTSIVLSELEGFGACKLYSESLVQSIGNRHALRYAILRIGSAYGPGAGTNLIADFVDTGRAGEKLAIWGEGSRRNQYTYVDDVVDGAILAARRAENEIVNLISEEVAEVRTVARMMFEEFGFDATFDRGRPEPPSSPTMRSRKAARWGWRPRSLAAGIRLMNVPTPVQIVTDRAGVPGGPGAT